MLHTKLHVTYCNVPVTALTAGGVDRFHSGMTHQSLSRGDWLFACERVAVGPPSWTREGWLIALSTFRHSSAQPDTRLIKPEEILIYTWTRTILAMCDGVRVSPNWIILLSDFLFLSKFRLDWLAVRIKIEDKEFCQATTENMKLPFEWLSSLLSWPHLGHDRHMPFFKWLWQSAVNVTDKWQEQEKIFFRFFCFLLINS